jgi:hypothetical protein
MTNNLGRTEVSVNQTQKEDTLNNSDARIDAAITDTISYTWSGADATKTASNAETQQHVAFVMTGSTTAPSPIFKFAALQRGLVLFTNNLSVTVAVKDFTSAVTVNVAAGLTVALYVKAASIAAVFESTSLSEAANDGSSYARRSIAWIDIGGNVNTQSGTSFTLALTDSGDTILASNAGAITVTVPLNATVAFPVGTRIEIEQTGAGIVTVAPAGGVTLNGPSLSTTAQFGKLLLLKTATNTWSVYNSVSSIALADFKDSCRVATTANITIATALNNGDSIDGVTLVTGDRVLVKNQTTGSENGIYVVAASPARATDFDSNAEVTSGVIVAVAEGTAGGDKIYMLTTNDTITVGTTSLTFATVGGGGAFLNLTDVPASYSGAALYKVRVNAAGTALEFVIDNRYIAGSFGGTIPTTSVVLAWMAGFSIIFPANLTGSVVKAKTAATAQTDFDLQKNGASVGTVRFAAAGTVATFVGVSSFTMVSGDYLELVSPGTADATLQNLLFSFVGSANA